MQVSPPSRSTPGFTVIEMLVALSLIGILAFLAISSANRAKERASQVKCAGVLRQFYIIAKIYIDDNDGHLPHYSNFFTSVEMICPSDKSRGTAGSLFTSSYEWSPFVFGNGNRLDDAPRENWLLVEQQPFHDLSKAPSAEPGKWLGRFNTLHADGSIRWVKLEQ
jgi:prepilin-type N-terminal cleavage/methylation domain-containing protein